MRDMLKEPLYPFIKCEDEIAYEKRLRKLETTQSFLRKKLDTFKFDSQKKTRRFK